MSEGSDVYFIGKNNIDLKSELFLFIPATRGVPTGSQLCKLIVVTRY